MLRTGWVVDGALAVALGSAIGGGDRSGLQGVSVTDFDREPLPWAVALHTIPFAADM